MSGKSNGSAQEADDASMIGEEESWLTSPKPSPQGQGVNDSITGGRETSFVEPDSATTTSPTSYPQSVSHGSLQDAVEMPLLAAPPNTPTTNAQDDNEVLYEEPQDNVTDTINQILDGYTPQGDADSYSPLSDRSAAPYMPQQTGSSKSFIAPQFGSPGAPPSSLPETPPSPVHPLRRFKPAFGLSYVSSQEDSTVSNSQRLLSSGSQNIHPGSDQERPQTRRDNRLDGSPYDNFVITTEEDDSPFGRQYSATIMPARGRDVSYAMRRALQVDEGSRATLITPVDSPSFPRSQGSHLPTTSAYADLRVHRDGSIDKGVQGHSQDESLPLRDSTGTSDWCTTEMNSDAGYISEPFPDHLNVIKTTGSSTAGISEDGEWPKPSVFRPRVIQHPGLNDQENSYEMHAIKPSKWNMFLPKAQGARAGGIGTNSSRSLTHGGSKDNLQSPLPRNLSAMNPFLRNDSSRQNFAPGSLTIPTSHTGRSRYEFRDSVSTFATNKLERHPSNVGDMVTQGKIGDTIPAKSPREENSPAVIKSGSNLSVEQTSSKVVEVSPQRPLEPRLVDQDYPNRRLGSRMLRNDNWAVFDHSSNAQLMTTRSKFEFDLIPLAEAQRLNKERRESGETDETENTAERRVRSENAQSIRAVPHTPTRIQQPSRARTRGAEIAPQLSMDFSPSSLFYTDALRDLSSPFSATTHPDLAQPQQVLLSSPTTVDDCIALSPAGEPSWISKMKARAVNKKESFQRKFSQLTVIHHREADHDSQLSDAAIEEMTEPHLTHDARARRQRVFIMAETLSAVFPFIAILAMAGIIDPVLEWYTDGEVRRLTIRQKNIIRNTFFAWLSIIMIVIPTLIAVYSKRS